MLIFIGTFAAFVTGLEEYQDSISAYYLGPIRDVFVGAMVGAAVCLVAYKGPVLEDYALNLTGFYALFVAFVPTQPDKVFRCLKAADTTKEEACVIVDPALVGAARGLRLDKLDEIVVSLQLTIAAVLAVTLVFLGVEWRAGHWAKNKDKLTPAGKVFRGLSTGLGVGFIGLVFWKGLDRSFAFIHLAATLLLIVGMATAVATHAWPSQTVGADERKAHATPRPHPGAAPTGRYQLIFWLMVFGLPLFLIVKHGFHSEKATIIAEFWEIGLFAFYWGIETKRKWND